METTTSKISKNKVTRFRKEIMNWYKTNGRDFPWRNKSKTKYEIVIAEILLRRTRAETISSYYRSFLKKYPSWKKLSSANKKELKETLKPIGLCELRSFSLFSLAKKVRLNNGKLPSSRKGLESLPGIGQYTASAVLNICHSKKEPLLDMNMVRLLERFFGPRKLADIRFDPYLQNLSRKILPTSNTKEFNWAILDFSSLICKNNNPKCHNCNLRKYCFYFNRNIKRRN